MRPAPAKIKGCPQIQNNALTKNASQFHCVLVYDCKHSDTFFNWHLGHNTPSQASPLRNRGNSRARTGLSAHLPEKSEQGEVESKASLNMLCDVSQGLFHGFCFVPTGENCQASHQRCPRASTMASHHLLPAHMRLPDANMHTDGLLLGTTSYSRLGSY